MIAPRLLRLSLPLATLGIGVLVGAGGGHSPAHATAPSPGRCATRTPSDAEMRRVEVDLARFRSAAGAGKVTIPVWVHVLSEGLDPEQGNVPDGQIAQQIQVLNDAYAGSPNGAPSPFRFQLAGVTRTVNERWFNLTGKAERPAKAALKVGGRETLNLYLALIRGDVLGYSYYPWEAGTSPLDGVVARFDTLPGGALAPYDAGDTVVHEVGHWLGLYHTFQQGCKGKGDRVADTPAERRPGSGCTTDRDTCDGPGLDPLHNFMDYSYDSCMFEFTSGQVARMISAFAAYRQ